jgi:hypothetical protein
MLGIYSLAVINSYICVLTILLLLYICVLIIVLRRLDVRFFAEDLGL